MKKCLLTILALFVITMSICQVQSPILWGMTTAGGTLSLGNIFKTNTVGTTTDMYDFGRNTDGKVPYGSLIKARLNASIKDCPMGGIQSLSNVNIPPIIGISGSKKNYWDKYCNTK